MSEDTEELEKEAEKEENEVGKPNPNPYYNPKYRGLLFHFLISFVTGIVTASIVLLIYTKLAAPKIPQFYSFDLSTLIQQKETDILKHPNQNMKAEIAQYIGSLKTYIDSYASHGIVLVTGASIGNSPYVKNITAGFTNATKKSTTHRL